MLLRLLFYFVIFVAPFFLRANNLDSLLQELRHPQKRGARYETLVQVAKLYRNYDLDSSVFFFKQALRIAFEPSEQINIIRNIGISFYYKNAFDSALFYYRQSLEKSEKENNKLGIFKAYNSLGVLYRRMGSLKEATEYYQKALKIAEELDDSELKARTYNNLGIVYINTGELKKAEKFYQKAIRIYQAADNKQKLANCYNNLGLVYAYQGDLKKAEEKYESAAQIFVELNMLPQAAKSYNNLALIYQNQGNYFKAVDFYYKALRIYEKNGDREGKAVIYNNLGNIYIQQKDFKNAEKYYEKALKLYKQLQDAEGIGEVYNNLGNVFYEKNKLEKSLEYYQKALGIFQKANNRKYIPVTLNNIADVLTAQQKIKEARKYYLQALRLAKELNLLTSQAVSLKGIGKSYISNREWNKGYHYLKQAEKLAEKTGDIELQRDIAQLLTDYYYYVKNYKRALEYQHLYYRLSDSISNKKYKELLLSRDLKLQYEKEKEIQNARHQAELEKQKLIAKQEQEKQRIVIFSIASVLLLLFVFFVVILNRYKTIRKQNRIITTQKAELEQQAEELRVINENLKAKNEEIQQQSEELRILNEMLTRQKAEIEQKNKDIMASIQYAYRLQKTLIDASNVFREYLPPHFLFFFPKDILSGDFYWIYKTDEYDYVAVADCTGHGVPGALISILGMEFLNQIMEKYDAPAPNVILDVLRQKFIERFYSGSGAEKHRDGMDISLIRIRGNTLEFAAANNPLYIITKNPKFYPEDLITSEFSEDEEIYILQINADKTPIGYYETLVPFSLKTLEIQPDDEIVLLSDGFQDQFGGHRGKKLGRKNLKRILLKIYSLPTEEQYNFLANFLNNWKNENVQTDDITVFGLKVS